MISKQTLVVARKEFVAGFHNRWFYLFAGLQILLAAMITRYGFSLAADSAQQNANSLILSILHLQMYLVPLLALVISYDSVLVEKQQGTLDLLLSYPITNADILVGKWLGFAAVLVLILAAGLVFPGWHLLAAGLHPGGLVLLLLLSILVGLAFLSIGILVSVRTNDRTVALGIALGVWVVAVILFDLALVALLVSTDGAVPDRAITILTMMNPAEIFRMLGATLLLDEGAAYLYGVNAGFESLLICWLGIAGWIVVPFVLALRVRLHAKT